MKIALRLLPLLLLMTACTEEEILVVHSELQPYFARFQEEGAMRNVEIDFEALRIEGDIADLENVSGQCQHNTVDPDKVVIDAQYWQVLSDLEKEFVVFHELGHCALNRSHDESTLSNGNCATMMHSGQSGCRKNYSSSTRASYIDELFENREE